MLQGLGPGLRRRALRRLPRPAGTAGAVLEHTWNYKIFSVTRRRPRGRRVRPRRPARRPLRRAGRSISPATTRPPRRRGRWCRASRRPWSRPGSRRVAAALVPAGGGARPPEARRRGGAAGGAQAGAARLERRAAPAHVHPRPVLRPAPRRARARARLDGRTLEIGGAVVRRGLRGLPRLSAAVRGSRGRTARGGGRPQLRRRRRCGQLMPASGCGAAGSTSASQAEDRGFESRHPLQSRLASRPPVRDRPAPPIAVGRLRQRCPLD